MEIINARSALLSNFEVLELLRGLESDHLARTKTAIRIKKEEEASGVSTSANSTIEISENVRTIQVEAIQYLSAEYQPASLQSSGGITQLVKDLAIYDLTKAEKLQVVNLAPTQPVELYVIVEEMEDRLGDVMEDVLSKVSASLSAAPSQNVSYAGLQVPQAAAEADFYPEDEMDANLVDDMLDHAGEGLGIEGDLEKEEE